MNRKRFFVRLESEEGKRDMELDKRSKEVFKKMIQSPTISSKDLSLEFELSRGQLNYTIDKINDYLEEKNQPLIARTRQGKFLIEKEVIFEYSQIFNVSELSLEEYVLSMEERIYVTLLIILSREEYLSLDHLVDELDVSRNTILRDVKELNHFLEDYHLNLHYDRSKGYLIQGDEWNKRLVLKSIIEKLYSKSIGEALILKVSKIDKKELADFKEKIYKIEKELSVEYTDDRILALPLLMIIIIRRIERGRLINYSFKINAKELSDTKEYLVTDKLFWEMEDINENERLYLTLQLLTANVSRKNILSVNQLTKMKHAIEETIDKFEKIAFITIQDKQSLVEKLMSHMSPAYYRIKYDLNLNSSYLNLNDNSELSSMYFLVSKSLFPLELFFDKSLPKIEVFFITLIISGHLMSNDHLVKINQHKKAIIVCSNGISISVLLEKTLETLLPEIEFVTTMSTRNFYKSDIDAIDYVFSVVPLETEKKVFLVDSLLSDKDKIHLRDEVLTYDKENLLEKISVDEIINIVKKHAVIENENLLRKSLQNSKKVTESYVSKPQYGVRLKDLLTEDMIIYYPNQVSWEKVVTDLGNRLYEKDIITEEYIETILDQMPKIPSYIVLGNTIALPHASPEFGAKKLGIGVAVLKQGIPSEVGEIKTIVLLSSIDKEEHINVLYELLNLSMSARLSDVEKHSTESEILRELCKFSIEEEKK